MESFVSELQKIVEKHGQQHVAERSGVNQSTISRLLSGRSGGRWATIRKLAGAYPELAAFFAQSPCPVAKTGCPSLDKVSEPMPK